MPKLSAATKAWGENNFVSELIKELTALGLEYLPLQQGLSSSSTALDDKLKLSVLNVSETNGIVTIKLSAFYTGIDAGCSCADDPTPIEETNEYCELLVSLNLVTALASIKLSK